MNPYNIDTSKTLAPLASLRILYQGMPKTSGCENCSSINGENVDWCCRSQSPSMYYCEFLEVYTVFKRWNHKKQINFILRAVANYLSNKINKGCMFYDEGCQVYNARPFACRCYGTIPKETWDKRWKYLKERLGDSFESQPQCTLVSSDRYMSPGLEDKWFEHTRNCEQRLGISQSTINLHDKSGGSYRTFHDHLLLEIFDEGILSYLTNIRLTNPTNDEINEALVLIREKMENAKTLPS